MSLISFSARSSDCRFARSLRGFKSLILFLVSLIRPGFCIFPGR